VEFRQAHVPRDLREPGLVFELALDELDGAGHARELATVEEGVHGRIL
jgi:hypothetical protein